MTATRTERPNTPADRLRASAAVQTDIARALPDGIGFVDIRTLGAGHTVVEVVCTSERDARGVVRALMGAVWELEADFRPKPTHDTLVWEGSAEHHYWTYVPIRVVAVIDLPPAPPLPEVHHWVTPDDLRWRAEHPEVTDEQATVAIDCAHRMELVGAL